MTFTPSSSFQLTAFPSFPVNSPLSSPVLFTNDMPVSASGESTFAGITSYNYSPFNVPMTLLQNQVNGVSFMPFSQVPVWPGDGTNNTGNSATVSQYNSISMQIQSQTSASVSSPKSTTMQPPNTATSTTT
jgi:hypothetical protein